MIWISEACAISNFNSCTTNMKWNLCRTKAEPSQFRESSPKRKRNKGGQSLPFPSRPGNDTELCVSFIGMNTTVSGSSCPHLIFEVQICAVQIRPYSKLLSFTNSQMCFMKPMADSSRFVGYVATRESVEEQRRYQTAAGTCWADHTSTRLGRKFLADFGRTFWFLWRWASLLPALRGYQRPATGLRSATSRLDTSDF